MPDTFHARILTPDGTLFEGEVLGLQVPGTSGSFEMKTGHAPIISTLDIGQMRVQTADAKLHIFAVSGGFVEMSGNNATVMAEAAENVREIDRERAEEARERARDQIRMKKGDKEVMELALRRAENRLNLIEKHS